MTPLEPLILIPAAFLAGVLMFLAPCTLPIVPGYLAFIAGGTGRGRVVRNALWFVIGFSAVFITLGLFAGLLGAFLAEWRGPLGRVAGVVLIIFGLTMLGLVRLPVLSSERHIGVPKFLTLGRPESSALLGALFALGWSPCVGPVLGTVLLFASSSTTAVQGAILLGVFSLGLGLPFLLTALLLEQATPAFAKMAGLAKTFSVIGGLVLVLLGVLMLVGRMDLLLAWGFQYFNSFYNQLLQYM